MKPISEFLNDQLGVYFAQEARLKHAKMGLTNRLMNEKDEDKAIQQIFEALDRFKIQVDDSKRASIAANWRVLSHSFRARKTTPPAASSTPSGGSPASLSSSGGAPSPVNNATAAVTSKLSLFTTNFNITVRCGFSVKAHGQCGFLGTFSAIT